MSNDNLNNAASLPQTTPPNRRKFLGMVGMLGAGAALANGTSALARNFGQPNLDAAIFNFALNLEYLEAAFYLAAVGRLGELDGAGGIANRVILPASFTGSRNGAGIPGMSAEVRAYAEEIADDELAHVRVIRAVLGVNAVKQPVLDLAAAFTGAGRLASGGAVKNFNAFANELFFLHAAFIFEDVGVTAYKGAARLLVDRRPSGNLENAAGILAVEAYHSGAIRTLLYQRRAEQAAAGLTVEQVVQAISDLRDAVDGSDDRDQGLVLDGKANIVPTDANGIAFSRTPRQIANIVLLDPTGQAALGGFFPQGLTDDGNLGKLLAL
jgi:hypothetical protein